MKCSICGKVFGLYKKNHYISIDDDTIGVSTIMRKEQVPIYDTFDCPFCGCQNIVSRRKRTYLNNKEEEDE